LSQGSDCVVDGDSGVGLHGLDCQGGEVHHEGPRRLKGLRQRIAYSGQHIAYRGGKVSGEQGIKVQVISGTGCRGSRGICN